MERALARIDAAFADAPRPSNEDLLHERCLDLGSGAAAVDSTIWSLAPVGDDYVAEQASQARAYWRDA